MHRNRTLLAALALVAALTVPVPASAQQSAPDAATIAADEAARQAQLAPFVGTWSKHGYTLTIASDGSAEASWRTYRSCNDREVRPPCDDLSRPETFNGGHARMRFDRVDEDALYGTVTETNAPTAVMTPPYPVLLVVQPNGTARLLQGDAAAMPSFERRSTDGTVLCGTSAAWETGVCGA